MAQQDVCKQRAACVCCVWPPGFFRYHTAPPGGTHPHGFQVVGVGQAGDGTEFEIAVQWVPR